jgi:outer membrane receptor protein involved in Fe transport
MRTKSIVAAGAAAAAHTRRGVGFIGACAAAGALTLPAPGHAQQSSAEKDTLQEITVTGSRIITNGNDMPTPVTVINVEQMKATTPATVFDQLNEIPAFVPTMGPQTPSGFNADANSGVASPNLRGLGAPRVLVLFDGHRVPPSTPQGFSNVNLMPQMLMQRVDVVTGGASAIYGSDAVSGVVNFIVDHNFNGIKFEAQGSQSSQSDDRGFQLGLAAGTPLFGGRGHIEASVQRLQDDGLPWISHSRPKSYNWTVAGTGSAADPYHLVQGATAGFATIGGLIQGGPLDGYSFDQNNVPTPANLAVDGVQNDSLWAMASSRVDQGFVRFDFDVSDAVHAYANFGASKDVEYGGFSPGVDGGMVFGACNAFLTPALQATLGCTNQADPNQPTFNMNKIPDPFINNLQTTESLSTMENFNLLAGIEGTLGNGYHWDTSVTIAQTSQGVKAIGVDHDPPWFAAMDAVVNPANGQIVCNVTLTNPGLYPGCTPIDMFGPSSESKAALAYAFGNIYRRSLNKTKEWEGSLRGTPLDGWAGPIGMAVSADFRRNDLSDTSTAVQDSPSCLGQRFGNCVDGVTHTWGNTIIPIPGVSQTAYEAAYEINVPLLKGLPLAQSVSTDDAYRFTRYNNKGFAADLAGNTVPVGTNINASNWKLGLVWTVNDVLTVRAARSRDMRAPNLWDLFQPSNYQPFSFGTPDYLCSANAAAVANETCAPVDIRGGNGAPTILAGNPYLKPEIGNTSTVGFVIRPTRELSLSFDYYDIKVTDFVTYLNGADRPVQKACYASGGTSPVCSLQVRSAGNFAFSPNNTVQLWYTRPVNLSELSTHGIDAELNYNTHIGEHAFSVRALVNHMESLTFTEPGLTQQLEFAGTNGQGFGFQASPKWRAQVIAHYNVFGGFDVDASERWRSSMRFQFDPTLVEVGHVSSVAYTNLNLAYTTSNVPNVASTTVFLNVQNLFDQSPPLAGSINAGLPGGSGDGWAIGDDIIGRYFTLGVRARL